jgi:uncharacterized protein (TIRG00374 family)
VKVKKTMIAFFLITILYIVALLWLDSKKQVFSHFDVFLNALPVLVCASFFSYLIRYARWKWLLRRADSDIVWVKGLLSYLAGFAFTATPGKVGELIRIRYFVPQGVPGWKVFSAFVYERAFDLIAVLLLAMLFTSRSDLIFFSLGFVALFLSLIVVLVVYPTLLHRLSHWAASYNLNRISAFLDAVTKGFNGCRVWLNPKDIVISLISGLMAWGITALSFVYLLLKLGIEIPIQAAISIYPLGMLVGAASMLPGGVGTTEVTLVALLRLYDVEIGMAGLAAIGIRLSSLWFAVSVGFISLGMMERKILLK